jgi:isochorismatase family protein
MYLTIVAGTPCQHYLGISLTNCGRDKPREAIRAVTCPDQKPIDRVFSNTWEDAQAIDAVKKTGRKRIMMAALWSEIGLAVPAIREAGEGYEVYAVTDASGGVSAEAHDVAVRRMAMAGIVPMTWMAVAGELQRDWAREETAKLSGEMFLEHGGGTGLRSPGTAAALKRRWRCLSGRRRHGSEAHHQFLPLLLVGSRHCSAESRSPLSKRSGT